MNNVHVNFTDSVTATVAWNRSQTTHRFSIETATYCDRQQPATAAATATAATVVIYNRNETVETCVTFICDHFCLCMTTENDHLCDHDHRSQDEDYQTSPDAELCWTVQMTDHHHHGTYHRHVGHLPYHPSPLLPDSSVHYTHRHEDATLKLYTSYIHTDTSEIQQPTLTEHLHYSFTAVSV